MEEQRLILVVEDDDATRAFLLENLAADGFRVAGASSAGEGIRAIEVRRPSLVILDLALEGGSGLELLDRVRHADGLASRIDPDLPVIVLSGRVAEADRVRSFARGADDHVCKPFLYAELLGRVRAVLRRAEGRRRQGLLRVGELTVDPSTRAVRLAGKKAALVGDGPELELAAAPATSIVAFRARPAVCPSARVDELNRALPEAVQARGRAFVTGTVFDSRETLRACILHPRRVRSTSRPSSPKSWQRPVSSCPPGPRNHAGLMIATPRRGRGVRLSVAKQPRCRRPRSNRGTARPVGRS
jgi:DNA-binding response OmpR family regulator